MTCGLLQKCFVTEMAALSLVSRRGVLPDYNPLKPNQFFSTYKSVHGSQTRHAMNDELNCIS